jgi:NADH-quinone oxidoreductase subunit A
MVPTLPTAIVAYLALFATVGFLFVFASLLLGRFLRADAPTPQKLETYECGEPAIGPGTVQFDIRFYVVALVFLIFEVELALFFPPAVIFGKAAEARAALAKEDSGISRFRDFGSQATEIPKSAGSEDLAALDASMEAGTPDGKIVWSPDSARSVARLALADLGVFFAVVLLGFAFVWRRGDLDWVRAVRHPATPAETAAWMSRSQRSGL